VQTFYLVIRCVMPIIGEGGPESATAVGLLSSHVVQAIKHHCYDIVQMAENDFREVEML